MLPKLPSPSKASEFRPVSCCSVIYKCITKLICSRLNEALPKLIHHNQSVFVKGREILHSILICQDLISGYSRQGISPQSILKLDLQKAFDSVHWGFLRELLTSLKFPTLFVRWIIACLSSVTFTVNINWQKQGGFKGGRGLKQGDPLSPLLFGLTMEYFTRLMLHAVNHPDFKFHPHCKELRLNHLMFADDVVIFSKAHPPH